MYENKKVVGVYHSRDLDGWMSGVIMKYAIPTIQLVGYDYGQIIPDLVWKADVVIVADVSFTVEEYRSLLSSNISLTLIDHHASNIREVTESSICKKSHNLTCFFDDSISASELCWKLLMLEDKVPQFVEYIGINDMKIRQDQDEIRYKNLIKPYCLGISSHVFEYITTGNFYKTYLGGILKNVSARAFIFFISSSDDEKNRYIEKGFTLMSAKKLDHQLIVSTKSHVRKIDNRTAICINYPLHEPDIFESIYDPEKHDMMFLYYHDGEKYICSVYSHKPEIDASEIAAKFGGGGHSYAAGFRTDSIMKVFGS